MEPSFTVAICGGGNLAHGCLATIGHMNKHFNINVLSRRPKVWQAEITAYTNGSSWENFGTLKGKLNRVSDDASLVVSDADLILICSPAHTKNDILKQIAPHLK